MTENTIPLKYGEKAYIFWKITNIVKSFPGVEIKYKKHPIMSFEIFGEYNERSSALMKIKNKIACLKSLLESQSTEVYNERIAMHKLNSLGSVLQEVKQLEEKYSSVSITVKFDGTNGDNVLPVVHIISDDARTGQQVCQEIQKVLKLLLYRFVFHFVLSYLKNARFTSADMMMRPPRMNL